MSCGTKKDTPRGMERWARALNTESNVDTARFTAQANGHPATSEIAQESHGIVKLCCGLPEAPLGRATCCASQSMAAGGWPANKKETQKRMSPPRIEP